MIDHGDHLKSVFTIDILQHTMWLEGNKKLGRAKIRVRRTNEFNELDSYGKGGVQAYYQYKFMSIEMQQIQTRAEIILIYKKV